MATLMDLARENGFKRPAPTLSTTTLVKDYFRKNPDKRIHVLEVQSVVSSRDPGITDKAVRSAVCRLATERGGLFLTACGRGFYKLSAADRVVVKVVQSITEPVKAEPAEESLQDILVQARQAQEKVVKRLDALYNRRKEIDALHEKEVSEIQSQMIELQKVMAWNSIAGHQLRKEMKPITARSVRNTGIIPIGILGLPGILCA